MHALDLVISATPIAHAMGCRFLTQYGMCVRLPSIDAVLSDLLQVCLAGSQLIGHWVCARDVLELCSLVSSLVQVMCIRDPVNIDLFLFHWYAGKGKVVSTCTNALSENGIGSAPCVQVTCAHRYFLGSVDVYLLHTVLHAVLGSTWERRSRSCSLLQSVNMLVDSHSCCMHACATLVHFGNTGWLASWL